MAQVTQGTRASVRRMAAAAAALLVFAVPSARAQLIVNGGFENGLTGWTLDGYVTVAPPLNSDVTTNTKHSGTASMRLTRQLDLSYGGYLYQPVASTTNTTFTLSFWVRGFGGSYFTAWASDGIAAWDDVVYIPGGNINAWTQYTATFQGYAGTTYIGFQSENHVEAYFVDDVDLTARVTSTPEPASMVLLGTGLLGIFGVARRRRQA